MSSIDQYQHRLLGFVNCPADFEIVKGNLTREIAIYQLLEDVTSDERYFDGKKGDIVVGGGSGEAPAMRISLPESLEYFFKQSGDDGEEVLYKAFWSPTAAYKFGNGFSKIGWEPRMEMDWWLAKNVCAFVVKKFSEFAVYDSDKVSFDERLFQG